MELAQSKKSILFVLPTEAYGTKERTLIKDMTISLEAGFRVVLATHLNSQLAEAAKSLGVECVPINDHFINRFTVYHKHYPLKSVIKKYKITIVHCYEMSLLISMVTQLRGFNLISLVITVDHPIDKPLQKFWYKPLISRIDFLILLNKHLKNDLMGNLALPSKKIEYFGMGVKNRSPEIPEAIEESFSSYKEYFLTGTYVASDLETIEPLIPILLGLKVINYKREGELPIKLCLIAESDFKTMPILKSLKEFIEQNDLTQDIIFASTKDVDGVMTKLSLWVSNIAGELVEDYAISALIHELPVLLPRNFCSSAIFKEYEGIGESFKASDSRELREKWIKILMGYTLYKDKARLFKFFIEKEHDYKIYRQDLLDLYTKMTLRRSRIFER